VCVCVCVCFMFVLTRCVCVFVCVCTVCFYVCSFVCLGIRAAGVCVCVAVRASFSKVIGIVHEKYRSREGTAGQRARTRKKELVFLLNLVRIGHFS